MASAVYRKQDKVGFKTTSQKHEEPIYVNTQIQSSVEPNELYYVLSDVDKEPIQDKPSENYIQRVWQKLKDNAVLILYVIQGLTLVALAAVSATLFLTGNDPVNGGWTMWAEWGHCSSTCGVGQQRRNRLCSYPEPRFGGKHCEGEASEYRICSATNCIALNGGWTMWAEWGQCSSTCGIGQQRRHRTCSNPEQKFGGRVCDGDSSEYRLCSATDCSALNGGWTMWAEWGQCSSTCGVGQQRRQRTCSDPEPKFGGRACDGDSSEYRLCSATNCTALNGGWTMWAEWGQCSSTCGVGQQRRQRTCSNPEPKFGGRDCEGESSEYRICSATNCTSLNGGWTMWTEWGQCSSTCGVGLRRRHRTCSNPEPTFGGRYCEGESSEYRICSATNCTDLDGGWTNWTSWTQCSMTCGTGLQRRERTCTSPEPKFGGKHCAGEPSEYQICNVSKCVDAVGFTAYNAYALYVNGEYRLYFSYSVNASDDSFNIGTGVFTCMIPGLYVFTATIVRSSYSSSYTSYCYIKVNGITTIAIYANGYSYTYPSGSGTVVVKLRRADTVYLGSCSGTSYLHALFTSFSGILVTADQN